MISANIYITAKAIFIELPPINRTIEIISGMHHNHLISKHETTTVENVGSECVKTEARNKL